MPREFELVTSVPIPSRSGIAHIYKPLHLADAFAVRLPAGTADPPESLARFIVSLQPSWVGWLTTIRDTIVARLGLKTTKHLASLPHRVGAFQIYSTNRTEIVLGVDDKHLDFRVSALCSDEPDSEGCRQLVVSTVVQCHNRLGRTYLFVIAPFHRWIVKTSLRRAARVGWPQATCPQGKEHSAP